MAADAGRWPGGCSSRPCPRFSALCLWPRGRRRLGRLGRCRFLWRPLQPSPASADTALLRAEPLPPRLAPSPQAPPHTGSSLLDPRVVPAARVLRPRVPRAAHGAVAPSGSPGVSSGSEAPRSVAGAPQGAPAEPPRTRTEAPSLPCSRGPASGRPRARGAWGRRGPSPGPGVPLTRAPLRVTDGKHWAQHVFKGLGVSRLGLSWYVCDQVLSDRMRVTRLLTTDLVRPSGDARS